mgnify:CR=1 FL=1
MYDALATVINTELGWFVVGTTFGIGIGASIGALLMASIKTGARYDSETETMLDGPEYTGPSSKVVLDFTGGSRPRVY